MKELSTSLATRRLDEQIVVVSEQNAPMFRRPVEKHRVFEFARSVFIRCAYVHITRSKSARDRP